MTESFYPIVPDTMTPAVLSAIFGMNAVSLVCVSVIGLLALRIGFIKKSVPVTLASAFVLSGLFGNIFVSLFLAGHLLMLIWITVVTLANKVKHIEV